MAFKLDKQESARREKLVADLKAEFAKIENQVAVYNIETAKLRAPLDAAVEAYNELLQEARGFAEDIARAADDEFDSKSEKWQEGERASAVSDWKQEWADVELEDFEIDYPEDLEVATEHADNLENLPAEPQ